MFKNTISQDLQDAIKKVMEANLHPNQQKIDVHEPEKDKITAHDFKKLRAMKKDQHGKITKEDTDSQIQELAGKAAQQAAIAISLIKAGKKDGKMPKPMKEDSEQVEEEEKKKPVSPFDYKNYKSQIPTKPGETAGFDSKKISTGTVYSRKPVKEESHQSKTTMKHIPNPSPALKKAAKDIKPGVAGYRDRIAMLKAGGVKEEVEQEEYTFADYLEAARAQYVDEDAVLVANEAFKNKDITLFSDQSQSPEA